MHSSTVIILLASVTQANAEEFNPPKAPVDTVGTIKASFDSSSAWPLQIIGTRDGKLESSGKFTVNKFGPFTWSLKASGSDFSNPSWPPSVLGNLGGSWETPLGNMRTSVESPVTWPMEETEASISLQSKKDYGDFCSTLKCTTSPSSWPPTAKSITSIKFDKNVKVSGLGDFSCAVQTNPDLATTASIEKTLDTDVGPVCCKLETSTEQWPPKNLKTRASLKLKKNIGNICCNLKMLSTGALQCTFEAASKLTATEDLAESSQDVVGISASLLICAFVCIGIAFALFRLRRGTLAVSREPLLVAA